MRLFILLFFIISNSIIYSQSRINNKLTDFGIMNYPDRKSKYLQAEPKKEKMDGQRLSKILSKHTIIKTTQQIELTKRNVIIGIRGTRITIAPGTFQYSDYLTAKGAATVHLYEVIDDFDYMISGVYHIYNDSKNLSYMELGGMIRFEIFQGNTRLKMSGESPILVDFPLLHPDKKFNLYYINLEGVWIKKYDHGSYDLYPVPESELDGKRVIGVRQFKMNSQGWWGFGIPHKDMTVVKGKYIYEGKSNFSAHIFCVGVGFRGYIGKWVSGGEFSISLFPNRKMRVYVADENGSIGMSSILDTGVRIGVDGLPETVDNVFEEIPVIELQKPPEEITTDRNQFLQFLQTKMEEYQVTYPTK
jgi:hypothetical protein